MKLATYTDLIRALPARSLIFRSKRETWEKALKTKALPNDLEEIFDKGDQVPISRQDIFDEAAKTVPNLKKVVYLTILWGYPTGMRRDYFTSIVDHMDVLTCVLGQVKKSDITDWGKHWDSRNKIYGLGLSTYSKLLYFLGVKVESHDALILDRQLAAVFQSQVFDDFSDLAHLKYENAPQYYVCYLKEMKRVAQLLVVPKENVEVFLFTFGSQLDNEH